MGNVRTADVSPDGTRIVFDRRFGDRNGDLYLMRPDGTGVQRLTNTPDIDESDPSWGPRSRRIAFARMAIANPQEGGIAVMLATPGATFKTIKANPPPPSVTRSTPTTPTGPPRATSSRSRMCARWTTAGTMGRSSISPEPK